MGVAFRAHDTLLDRDVAVRVLSQSTLESENRSCLLREAPAAIWLDRRNVIPVHDPGTIEVPGIEGTVPSS
jgi:hypothetical protein